MLASRNETIENRYNFFSGQLVEFTNDPVWARGFLFRKVTDDQFLNRRRPVHIIYFFLCGCWQMVSFEELVCFV